MRIGHMTDAPPVKSAAGAKSSKIVAELRENAKAAARNADAWGTPPQPLWGKAADEIERLMLVHDQDSAELRRLDETNDRLRAALQWLNDNWYPSHYRHFDAK